MLKELETQLHPFFACELSGVDITSLAGLSVSDLERLVVRYALVVLRNQDITDEQQIAFSRRFGPLELPPDVRPAGSKAATPRIAPQMYDVSNIDANGEILPPASPKHISNRANEEFHTDSSFNQLPTKWSFLSARVVPPIGGDTLFVDTRVVFDALPMGLRERARGVIAEHSFWKTRAAYQVDENVRNLMPPARHPLVRIIPESGREALYAGAHASRIPGWTGEDSLAFLGLLNDFATQPKFVYTHHWHAGDLVIWDNRCTLHRATYFDTFQYKRDLRRTTINEFGIETSSTETLNRQRDLSNPD